MGLFCSLKSTLFSSLYIFNISPLSDVELVKIIFPICWLPILLIEVSFALQKCCNIMRSLLTILYVTAQASCSIQEFPPYAHMFQVLPTFSSVSLSVSGFMWMSLSTWT